MSEPMNRRGFLERGAVAAGAVAAAGMAPMLDAPASLAAAAATKPSVAGIGLQLYTVRDQVDQNIEAALEAVARVGYKVVEFAGYGNRTAEQIRAVLDRLKLTAPSTHVSLQLMRTQFDAQLAIAQTLGHKYITIPSLGGDMPLTTDGYKRMADEFNTIATKLKPSRIGLAFHSHRDEFMAMGDGKKGMDVFIANTDPSLVTFEIDLGWATVAGEDPADWFRRYPGRIKMWHVKDIAGLRTAHANQQEAFRTLAARAAQPATPPAPPATAAAPPPAGGVANLGRGGAPAGAVPPGAPGRGGAPAAVITGGPVPIGAGEIDYTPIFALWKTSGLEHFFVEQDSGPTWPGGSIAAITTSYRNLRRLLT